jgi:hypothetical protein
MAEEEAEAVAQSNLKNCLSQELHVLMEAIVLQVAVELALR